MSDLDASSEQPEATLLHDSTLLVDQSVTLRLGSESLLIVGKILPVHSSAMADYLFTSCKMIVPLANRAVAAAVYASQVSWDFDSCPSGGFQP